MFTNFLKRFKIRLRSIPVKRMIKKLGKGIPIYFDYDVPLENIRINILDTDVNSKGVFSIEPVIIKVIEKGTLEIEDLTVKSGCYLSTRGPLKIGKGCFLNENCSILARARIEIGDNLMCADNVYIRDNDGHYLSKNGKEVVPKKIKIGNNVWIGRDSTVLKGVTIGNNVVIGAKSVVTKDIPSNCIAAGNPAKVIYKGKVEWHR